jgi:3-phosphoshikimate 1-carboxyvinyltransferase
VNTYEIRPRTIAARTVRPPGSKSITNRALVAAALAAGESRLADPLRSDDTGAMIGCLRNLGVQISDDGAGLVVRSDGAPHGGGRLDARASGTTARFITAAAALADGPSIIDGTARMRERPIGALIAALRGLGAVIDADRDGSYPPVRTSGGGIRGGRITIDGTVSSQFISAVLLSAPRADGAVTIELSEGTVSRPYLTTTLEVMASFGADARWSGPDTIAVAPTGYRPTSFEVEADASAAVYPWAAAAITGATITVAGIHPGSTQADMSALGVLERMGSVVTTTGRGIAVTGPTRLEGVKADLNDCPDAALGLAVVATFAGSATRFTNIANLRVKETDRLAALETELTRLGAQVETGADWIEIHPGPPRPARIRTYDDHRMAMSFAVAGLARPGIVIEDPECVAKTWPGFFDMLESL